MTDHILGSYQHYKSEDFEEFLAASNVPLVVRKVLASTNPRVDISKDGETWTLTFKIMIKRQTNTFVIGKEFTETNPITSETSKCLASINAQGNLEIRTESPKGIFYRTIIPTDEGMTIVMSGEGIDLQARRYFKRISK